MSQLWNTIIFEPMLNSLLVLYSFLGRNFGLSIIVFTILVRVLTLPITMKQMKSARASQEMQPRLQELQKKYKGDQNKLAEEQMKLYKEAGVNPLGCLVPTLIQFPIWIGLYQSILNVLPSSPLQFINLAKHIYEQYPFLSALIPLNPRFLWLDLGRPDQFYILPVLVVATMWAQQKMMATPSTDPQQQAMSQTMEFTMPMMFGLITLQSASGLALYFAVTNAMQIVQQYSLSGWGGLAEVFGKKRPEPEIVRTKGKGNGRKS